MTEQITLFNFINLQLVSPQQNPVDHARELLLSGGYQACLTFIHLQPTTFVENSAHLLVYQAAAMLFSEFAQEKIIAALVKAESLDTTGMFAGEIAAIRAIICSYTENPDEGIKQSKIALHRINPDNTFFKNIIERNLGVAYTLKNDLINANFWFERLLMSSCQLEDWGGVLAAYNYLTYIRKVQGRLREAEIIYQKALLFINDHQLERMPHSIKIISGYGHLLMYWHRLDEAKQFFQQAIQIANQTDIIYAYTAYQHLCEVHIRERDLSAAQVTLDKLQECVRGKEDFYENIHLKQTERLKARLFIDSGRVTQAEDWLITSGFEEIPLEDLFNHFGYELGLTLPIAAHVYILKGKTDRAIEVLKAVIPRFIHQCANSYLIRALTALSVAYEQKGKQQTAVNTFKKAISLAESDKNLGDFLLMGQSLIPVLSLMLKSDMCTEFTLQLVNIFQNQLSQKIKPHMNQCGVTALSKREVDVLRLLVEGKTNREIAEALFLSSNTIKSHRNNIYRKLDVVNRGQAITKARQLGIIMMRSGAYY
jgi:LuxR family maltose regulon positive regulatory protein